MRKLLAVTPALLIAMALVVGAAGPAQAADPGLLLILDFSGSMWGRVDGQPKISIAKKVVQELIAEAPGQVQLGLMAYGHRKKGDCQDIELIAQLGAAKEDLLGAVKRLSAKGKTPIADSLLKAAELLAAREGDTTLVLVSDGIETCGGDPCKVAGEIKQKGLKLIIHVVGFDVSSKQAGQLKCIAAAGGGQYFSANNLEELKAALGKIKTSVVEQKPLPPAPQAAEAAAGKAKSQTLKIAGPGTVKLKLAQWAKMPKAWALVNAETGKEAAKGNTDTLKAKPGEYQIRWRQSEHEHGPALLNEVVRVQSGKTVEAPIDTGIRLTTAKGVKAPHAWYLTDPADGQKVFFAKGSLDPQVAPAGEYDLWWHQQDHGSIPVPLGRITVEAGKLNDILADGGINPQPAEWVNPKPRYYALLNDKGERLGNWNFFAPQLAPAGKYTLVLRPDEHRNNELVWGEVTIPEHGFVDVPINSGAKFTHAKGAKPPYRIIFVNLDNNQEYVASETWEPLPLPPGRYRLEWWEEQHGSQRTTLAEEVELPAGVLLEVEM